MEDKDLLALAKMVEEYPIQNIIDALHQIISDQADVLSDQQLSDKARELTRVAWHLNILSAK
jgi:hypothetical protein